MRNALALATVLVVAGWLLFPTVAAPGGDDLQDSQVVVEPHSGPNGDITVVEDGELALDFTEANENLAAKGLNPDSRTPFDRVFTITYTGDQSAEVYLSSEAEGLSFYRGDDPSQSIEGEANAVQLAPNETVDVGVLLDTADGDLESVDAFTVHATLPESGESTTVVTTTQSSGGGGTGGGDTGDGGTGGGDTGDGGTGGGGTGGGVETTTAATTMVNTTTATTTAQTTVATTTERTTSPAPTTRTTSPRPTTRTTSPGGTTTTAGTTSQSPPTSTTAQGSTSASTSERATTSESPGTEPPTASRPPDDAPPADGNSGSPGLPAFLALLTGTFGLVGVLYWAIAVR